MQIQDLPLQIQARITEIAEIADMIGNMDKISVWYEGSLWPRVDKFHIWHKDDGTPNANVYIKFGYVPSYTAVYYIMLHRADTEWQIVEHR